MEGDGKEGRLERERKGQEDPSSFFRPNRCQRFHAWYMEESNRPEAERRSGITVKFKPEHFMHDECVFAVTFDDIFGLFTLNALDASLVRCWTL